MIELKNIDKFYKRGKDDIQVLKNINLKIEKGDFLAIMGQSGAGKSTLIKILGLLDTSFKGEYLFDGVNVSDYSDDQLSELRNKKLGFVFQNFNLINRLTVKENIELPNLYSDSNLKKDKVIELLKKFDIESKLNTYPTELSGGQQQRVSIARSLYNNPDIIIADEPTGALDSATSKEVINLFKEINAEGTTIILITHDPNVAKQAKKTIVIFDGEIEDKEVNE